MSLAIKTADGDFIYFDAVINFRPSYTNVPTKHPIDGGGRVNDHYIEEHPVFAISGVVSDADFNWTDRPTLTQEQAGMFDRATIQFKNNNPVVIPAEAEGNLSDSILDFQAILGRLIPETVPNVTMMDTETTDVLAEVKRILISIRNSTKQDIDKSLFTLISFDGNKIVEIIEDCVFLALDFPEDPQTGTALFIEAKIEQMKFVSLEQTTIPKSVQDSMRDKASPVVKKGNQTTGDPFFGQKRPRDENKMLDIYEGLGG